MIFIKTNNLLHGGNMDHESLKSKLEFAYKKLAKTFNKDFAALSSIEDDIEMHMFDNLDNLGECYLNELIVNMSIILSKISSAFTNLTHHKMRFNRLNYEFKSIFSAEKARLIHLNKLESLEFIELENALKEKMEPFFEVEEQVRSIQTEIDVFDRFIKNKNSWASETRKLIGEHRSLVMSFLKVSKDMRTL